MKKIIVVLKLLLILMLLPGWTSIGFNFRDTAGFVTDGTGETYVLGETSSQTRGGATFSWSACSDCKRDRDSGLDRRLAGDNFVGNSGTQTTWTMTSVTPGSYKICIALGDASFDSAYQRADIYDDTTLLFTVITGEALAGNFGDAFGTMHSAANWPANNVCKTGQVFATSTLKVKLGSTTAESGASRLAHIYLEAESGASTKLPVFQAIGAIQ